MRAYQIGAELDFSRIGKPTVYAFNEAFNGRFEQECLNEDWFLSLLDAEEEVEIWRGLYYGEKPPARWATCPLGNTPYWQKLQIYPQDSHYSRDSKGGKGKYIRWCKPYGQLKRVTGHQPSGTTGVSNVCDKH